MAVETKQEALDVYEINEKLGEGTYGVVYKAKLKNSNPEHHVALKKIKIDPNDEGIPATTIRELSLLNVCKHPCVVELEKSLCIKGELWLVFEFVKNDLKKYLDGLGASRIQLPMKTLKKFSYMLIEGVKFCHSRRILHRDLKPQNILVSSDGQLKIADFGLGREHGLPIGKLTHEVVTLWYRPPEILMGQEKYSGACDMWGVGCIIAEMATRHALFMGDCEIDQLFQIFQILGTPNEDIWPGVSKLPDYKSSFPQWKSKDLNKILKNRFDQHGIKLLYQLLEYAPNKRITAKEALKSPWFDDVRQSCTNELGPFYQKQDALFQGLNEKHKQMLANSNHNNNNSNNNSNSNNNNGNDMNQENINPNQSKNSKTKPPIPNYNNNNHKNHNKSKKSNHNNHNGNNAMETD